MKLPPDCARIYRAVRLLGAGGHGVVYLAEHLGLGRAAAIKLLKPLRGEDSTLVTRFLDEARITAALAHPRIVVVYDLGGADGTPWIAYELIEGSTLREELAHGPLELARALEAGVQIASALEHAHANGVLHRDIKPDNVFALATGGFKVADFGIAKWSREGAVKTQTGVLMATPHYVSPEQIRGAPASAASDIYAVGAVLAELITGRPPFDGAGLMEVLDAHLNAALPHLSTLRRGVPEAVEAVVRRALAKAPEARQESAARLTAELLACRSALGVEGSEAAMPRPRAQPDSVAPARSGVPTHAVRDASASPAATRELPASDRPVAPAPASWPRRAAMALAAVALAPLLWIRGTAPAPPVTRPAHVPVLDFSCRPTSRDALVDFNLPAPHSLRVEVRGPGGVLERRVDTPASSFHERVGGLMPDTPYSVRVVVGDELRGLEGFRFRTLTTREAERLDQQVAQIETNDSTLQEVGLGVVEGYPHPRLAAAYLKAMNESSPAPYLEIRALIKEACGLRDPALGLAVAKYMERIVDDDTARSYTAEAVGLCRVPSGERWIQSWLEKSPFAPRETPTRFYSSCVQALAMLNAPGAAEKIAALRETGPANWVAPQLPESLIRTSRALARTRFEKWLAGPVGADGRDLRAVAVSGLGLLDDEAAVDQLASTGMRPATPADDVPRRAVEALGGCAAPAARDRIRAALASAGTSPPLDVLWAATRLELPEVVPLLSATLEAHAASPARRAQAAGCLGFLRRAELRTVLEDSLVRATDSQERTAISWALLQIGAPGALAAARTALSSGDLDAQALAAWSLGEARDREAEPVLRQRIAELRAAPRTENLLLALCALALAEVAGQGAIGVLRELAVDKVQARSAREAATTALERLAGRPHSAHLVLPLLWFQRTRVKLARGDVVSLRASGKWGFPRSGRELESVRTFVPDSELPPGMNLRLEARLGTSVLSLDEVRTTFVVDRDAELLFTPFGGAWNHDASALVKAGPEQRGPLRGFALVVVER